MTAKEMFEKAGYRLFNENDYEIEYTKQKDNLIYHIIFFKFRKTIEQSIEIHKSIEQCYSRIEMPLLMAINKKVEELGWNK